MSRCFPYPPPGYTRNGIRDEALIQSIKLQREAEKAKIERRKEKKKEKKGKEKSKENRDDDSKKPRHKKRHREEKNQVDEKGRDFEKKNRNDAEQLEKSSITEEHANPAGSQNSSDSTLNCKKRQNLCSSSDDKHNSGSIIRIRLPMQRHKDSEVLPIKGQPPSALGKSDNPSNEWINELPSEQCKEREQPKAALGRSDYPLDVQMQEPASVTGRHEHLCSTSGSTGQDRPLTAGKDEKPFLCRGGTENSILPKTTPRLGLCRRCPPSFALQLRDLVENWNPPQLQTECTDLENDNWLFGTNWEQRTGCAKRCDTGITDSSFLNNISWPMARHLPEADIYALPFTIPF